MTKERIEEENKVLRDEVCRQRVALGKYKSTIDEIVERYKKRGEDCCQLIAENAVLKNVIMSTGKAKRKLGRIDIAASIKNIIDDGDEPR